jgi:hypothetical protein
LTFRAENKAKSPKTIITLPANWIAWMRDQ